MITPISATNTTLINLTKFSNKVEKPHCFDLKNSYEVLSANNYPKNYRNISFTGMSLPVDYNSTSDYYAAIILKNIIQSKNAKNEKLQSKINSSALSKTKIKSAIDLLYENKDTFFDYKLSDKDKVKWNRYVPEDVKAGSIVKINDARNHRFEKWKKFLLNPYSINADMSVDKDKYKNAIEQISNDNCVKFIIWNAINHEIDENNRHIPVPFNIKALDETLSWLNSVQSKNRAYQINSEAEFLNLYTSKLKENLLQEIETSKPAEGKPEILKKTKDGAYWVKIPRLNKRFSNNDNIHVLEILSNENWCTRSGIDKAKAALQDGNFYVFIKPGKDNILETLIGIACFEGKADQIQGPKNDNIIPLEQLENVKEFLSENKIECGYGLSDGCSRAGFQILIAERLNKKDSKTGIKFQDAIDQKNNNAIFRFLGYKIKPFFEEAASEDLITKIIDGKITPLFKIEGTYIPKVNLGKNGIHVVPYSFFEIDEDNLLQNVSEITNDLVLTSPKNSLIKSFITEFPKKLKTVGGKIYCTQEQYNKFYSEMIKTVNNDESRIVIVKD